MAFLALPAWGKVATMGRDAKRSLAAWLGVGALFVAWPVGAAPEPRYDLLLRNGHVIDPKNGIDGRRDVAVTGGKIAAVERTIAANTARRVIDVRGFHVAPGFIDMHAHVGFGNDGRPAHSPASYFTSGATTVVDAGSWGARDFQFFRDRLIDRSSIRILAFINIVSTGMEDEELEQDPRLMEVDKTALVISKNRDVIVGIKTAHYWTKKPWDAAHPPWASVDSALKAAEKTSVPIMVDFWPRPPERSYEALLARLRPGDIHTHVFAQQFPVLDDSGKVSGFMRTARARGVLFDLGHGAGSFWFRNAFPAIKQGFIPDTFGTDLHQANLNGPVVSLVHTMGKMMSLGVPIGRVIEGVTSNAARAIHRPQLGNLSVGSEADVAVFEIERGRFSYTDCGRARMTGNFRLRHRLTLRGGRIASDPDGLSMVEWDKAGKQYFTVPKLQSDPPSSADPDWRKEWDEQQAKEKTRGKYGP